jgi:hypothetical protein
MKWSRDETCDLSCANELLICSHSEEADSSFLRIISWRPFMDTPSSKVVKLLLDLRV